MAFGQITGRTSLRGITACLNAQPANLLYHCGFRGPVHFSTLARANERRDWRIHAGFAQRMIARARTLYADTELDIKLADTVCALDSSTIDPCLALCPWARFRRTRAAVNLHALLDLRGSIPRFLHISAGKLHNVNVLGILAPEPGAINVMDRAYVDSRRLYLIHQTGAFFVTRAKRNLSARCCLFACTRSAAGCRSRPNDRLGRPTNQEEVSRATATRPSFRAGRRRP